MSITTKQEPRFQIRRESKKVTREFDDHNAFVSVLTHHFIDGQEVTEDEFLRQWQQFQSRYDTP